MKATEGHTVGLVNGKTFVWQKKCVKNKRCRKWMITEVMVWRCSSCQSYFRFFILAVNYNICWQQRVNWIKCTRKNWSYRWWSVSVSCVGAVWCIQWKPAFGGVKTSDDSLYWQQYCCTSWSSACIFSLFPHKALLVFCSGGQFCRQFSHLDSPIRALVCWPDWQKEGALGRWASERARRQAHRAHPRVAISHTIVP